MKFLMNVGAEKAGTTWLWKYFETHPDFAPVGKEMNIIERDTFVPTLTRSHAFKKDINNWFKHIAVLDKPSGDFTHYEGSSENIFRIFKQGFEDVGIEIVPVYIMRDPITRAWSCWNMFYDYIFSQKRAGWSRIDSTKSAIIEKITDISTRDNFDMHPVAKLFVGSYLTPEYKRTIEVLDNVFDDPLYFFYEQLFDQKNLDLICDRLEISHKPIDPTPVNKGGYEQDPPQEFIDTFCDNRAFKENVTYVTERFENVPWRLSDYI